MFICQKRSLQPSKPHCILVGDTLSDIRLFQRYRDKTKTKKIKNPEKIEFGIVSIFSKLK